MSTPNGHMPLQEYLNFRNNRAAAAGAKSFLYLEGAGMARPAAEKTLSSVLPKGISGGKIAAFVAGTALIAGAIHLATRPKQETRWADRIDAERQRQAQAPAL